MSTDNPPEASPLTPAPPRPVPMVPRPEEPAIDRAEVPEPNPNLPPVPFVDGPLRVRVVYPPAGAIIASRDSNFVLGSVGTGRAGLRINGTLVPVWPNGSFLGWLPNPPVDKQYYEIVAYTATDTVRVTHSTRTRAALPPTTPVPPAVTRFTTPLPALLQPPAPASVRSRLERIVSDTDQVVIGRPTPTGTYRWFLLPKTPAWVLQYRNDMAEVRLDAGQSVWVSRKEVQTNTAQTRAISRTPLAIAGAIVVDSAAQWIDIRIPVAQPRAYLLEARERGLTVTLYNTSAPASVKTPIAVDRDLKNISLTRSGGTRGQPARVTLDVSLARPLFGYLVLYGDGVMTLRVRRPPMVDSLAPLSGLTIAVDAGHPPAGTTGPLGTYEAVPNLAVAMYVRDMLQAKGATVVMTRTTADTVALNDRPVMARQANADALVSIHLNAVPDGTNPFRAHGTGMYYFHPHAKRLATLMQQALVPELKLRDLGVFHANLALARPTWMPSVLAEGLFLIIPEQEAAILTPEYQAAYARGVVNGLEQFFRTLTQ